MVAPARSAALDVLGAVRRGDLADRAFDRVSHSLAEADRRLTQELAYGVLRLRARLDHVIDGLVVGGIGRLEPQVLEVLRLAAYQLLELERVPAYAAVSDAVEAAKRASGKGAASLTNAVLRRLSDASYESFGFPQIEQDPLGHLTVWGSHPSWMVERWLGRWPVAEVLRLVDYNNRRPRVYLTVFQDRERAVARLRGVGVKAEPVELASASIEVRSDQLKRALDAVVAIVQDPGAAAVVDFAALDPGARVVDLCAAPGGKAAALAAVGHEVLAFDIARPRLGKLLENRDRLDLKRMHIALADSTRPPLARAPALLLDVPCTGTGTLGRHPDGRWRLALDDLEALAGLQRRLLDSAAGVVEPGGLLIYSTCSLEAEENEEQVAAFLARHTDFEIEAPPESAVSAELISAGGELKVLPQQHDMDGAYAARLRRRTG